MSSKYIIGCDVGILGAYCVLNMEGEVIHYANFPLIEEVKKNHRKGSKNKTRIERYYDRKELFRTFPNCEPADSIAYMESVHSRPGEGAATSFKFGDCFGQLKMLLTSLAIPVRMVTPQEWCRHMHKGIGTKEMKAKQRSYMAFERLFTDVAHSHYKKVPDGIVDAALIAEYGRFRLINGMDEWRLK